MAKSLDTSMDEAAFTKWFEAELTAAEKLEDASAKQAKMAYLDETLKAAAAAFKDGKSFALPTEAESVSAVKAAAKAQLAKAAGTEPNATEQAVPATKQAAAVVTKLTEVAPDSIGKEFRKIPPNASEDAVFGNITSPGGLKLRTDGQDIYRR